MTETFINQYIKTAGKSSGITPINIGMLSHVSDNDTARHIIIEVYKNHPSVTKIKQIFGKNTITNSFTFHSIAQSHVATLLKQTDIKKTAGLEKMQPNLVNLL